VANRSINDKQKVLDIIKSMELESISEILSTLTNRWFTDNFIKKNKSIVDRRIQQVIDTNPEVFLNVFKIYAETEMISWLKEIKKPCLVLTGENDLGCSPKHNKKISLELTNSKLIILPNVKHAILLESPNEITKNILKFLNNL
jgi:pimeloyl-ACP methyl ester carboxylesterase